MYVPNVYSRLARSLAAGQKRSLHPCVARHRLARSRARRCASVGGTARLVVVHSGAYSSQTARDWSVPRADWPTRLNDGTERCRVHADTQYTHSGRLFSGLFHLSSPISLLSRWSLSSLRLLHRGRGFILSFASRFPNPTYFVSRSLVRSKAVSQRRSTAREIPRTRYEFTFLLLYSTLACPPFCLLEPLVYLADLRLPYVSAAQLSHRSHSPSFSLSLFPPVYAHDHAVPTSSSTLFFSLFLLFFFSLVAIVIIVVVDVGLHDAVSRSRKVRYGRGEQSRKKERVSRSRCGERNAKKPILKYSTAFAHRVCTHVCDG